MAMQYVKVRADRVKEATLFEGLNDVSLAGTGSGFRLFSDTCQDGDRFDYAITHPGTDEWETGVGVYDGLTNTVIRETITASSYKPSFPPYEKSCFTTDAP